MLTDKLSFAHFKKYIASKSTTIAAVATPVTVSAPEPVPVPVLVLAPAPAVFVNKCLLGKIYS